MADLTENQSGMPVYLVDQSANTVSLVSGRVPVDGSGVTQPVSGTVTATISGSVAATQSGTWTVQPGNTANTTAWLVARARDAQVSGRTNVQKNVNNVTATTTIHTVTAGKKFYLSSIVVTGYNQNTATFGRIAIQDNATVVIPMSIQAGSSLPTSGAQLMVSTSFTNSLPSFATNVNLTMIAGTMTASVFICGYEE
jgi:hypothetical protein